MKNFKAVVVGTGFIGPVHVEGLRRAGVEVAGIIGSTPEKSLAAAEKLGIKQDFTTFAEVLKNPDIDVVHLTTPNRFHFEQAQAVLQAGKHVLCEKPLAMNSRESESLVQLAEKTGLAAGVAYNIRFYSLCHEAAYRIQQQKWGLIYHITGSYVQDWLLYPTDFNWRVLDEEGGALRAVADIGTHWLDLVQFITGLKVTAVCADLKTVHPVRERPVGGVETFSGKLNTPREIMPVNIKTEDAGCIMLRFQQGVHGYLWVSQTTAGRKNCLRFEIAGSQQTLAWNSETPNELWVGERDKPNQTLLKDPALLSPSARNIAQYPGGHNEGFPDSFKQLFRTFYGAIESGEYRNSPPIPTFSDGHHEILLCEAITQSHQEQRWVEINK